MKRISSYDLIRVVAMLLVVWFHMNVELIQAEVTSPFLVTHAGRTLTLGQQGVVLFIMISGATQCISYEKQTASGAGLKKYYKKRFLALMPMFYAAYFLGYVICRLSSVPFHIGRNFIWTILGMDGYLIMKGVPTAYIVGEWFLGLIILLYMIFPLLYKLICRFPKCMLAALLVYCVLINQFYHMDGVPETDVLVRLVDFALGIYLYLYVKQVRWWQALGAMLVFLACTLIRLPLSTSYYILLQGLSAYLVLFYLGTALGKWENIWGERLRQVLAKLGKYSYAVFLMHHIVIQSSLIPYKGVVFGHRQYVKWSVFVIVLIAGMTLILDAAAGQMMKWFAVRSEKKK